jgi:hypothetical protein
MEVDDDNIGGADGQEAGKMNMRCDKCKFWKDKSENPEWEAGEAGFKQCLGVRARWRIQDEASSGIEWDNVEEGQYMKRRREALKNARAYVQDGSEYRAELFTAPDFFCALFTTKVD